MSKKMLIIMLIICLTSINITTAQIEQSENIIYKTHDGRWVSELELEKGTSNYPYLIEDVGDNWKYTADGKSIFIPKAFNIIESPTKISPCLTYSKIVLANNMINHNETISYLRFPYSLSSVKTRSNENNIKFGAWTFWAGNEHISIYDESGNYLNPEYYDFRIINDEIRLYFITKEANLLYGNITFEMHSWILEGYTSFSNSGDYFIDYDLSNLWIKDSIESGVENVYIAEKTGNYSSNGNAVFLMYDDFNTLDWAKWESTEESKYSIESGTLKITPPASTTGLINSKNSYSNVIIETRYKTNDVGSNALYGLFTPSKAAYSDAEACTLNMNGEKFLVRVGGVSQESTTVSANLYYRAELVIPSSGTATATIYSDDLQTTKVSKTGTPTVTNGYISFLEWSAGIGYVDWTRSRQYTTATPVVTVLDKTTYYEITVNSTIDLTDYQIAIPCAELNITNSGESWNIYQSVIHPVENLTATPYIENALLEWDDIQQADYYNVYRVVPSILYTNESLVLDGELDTVYTDIGQRGLLRTPNPEYSDQFDTIYAVINDTYMFMYANAHDSDTSSTDDSIEIYFDFAMDGLNTGDKGYIITENAQLIEQVWSGTKWISGGATNAECIVQGSGTNNTDYELFIPLTDMPELLCCGEIYLTVMHENTAIATTQSYFPSTAFSIENVTGWQNMFIENSSEAGDVLLFNTTDNMFNLTGLDSISWYRVGVSAVLNITETNITYVEFITQHYPEYSVDGYVSDINTTLGIPNVIVTVTDTFTQGFKITDSNGYYKFENLRNDYYTLDASATGYSSGSTNVTISGNNVTAGNIYLEFISYTLEEIYNKIEETNINIENKIYDLELKIINLKMFILFGAILTIGALYNDRKRR